MLKLYDELDSNDKSHLSNILDGFISFIELKSYTSCGCEDVIASLIKIYTENGYYFDKDEFIELIKENI